MSPADYSRIRTLTVREIVGALIRDGFYLIRKNGSHHQFFHPNKGRVTVSFHHPGDTFPIRTLKVIIQDAGWTELDLRRLKLLK